MALGLVHQQVAAKEGLAPDGYVTQLLEQNLAHKTQAGVEHRLSAQESILLQRINTSLDDVNWQRYHNLLHKRDTSNLSVEKQGCNLSRETL
jgi:hypothetical protein